MRNAAEAINAAAEEIDILINNAAIMACPYAKTEDGIESQFGTNYIGHFLLTNLLLKRLREAKEGARVVNLTSSGSAIGEINFADVNFDVGAVSTRIENDILISSFPTRMAKHTTQLPVMGSLNWQSIYSH